MNSTSLRKVIKNLINISEKKYGKDWKCKLRKANDYEENDHCWYGPDDEENTDEPTHYIETIKRFYSKKGYKLLGFGEFRVVFGWKDIVIKINCKNPQRCAPDRGNEEELKNYSKIAKIHPGAKYFVAPLLFSLKYKKSLILVFPKIKVDVFHSPTNKQDEMDCIHQRIFKDMHEENVGVFCNGMVAIDLNFGLTKSITWRGRRNIIQNFVNENKRFWKKYTISYKSVVNVLKNKYKVAV